jgi:hypothetical protein
MTVTGHSRDTPGQTRTLRITQRSCTTSSIRALSDVAVLPTLRIGAAYDISARHEVTNLEIVERALRVLDRDMNEWGAARAQGCDLGPIRSASAGETVPSR